MSEPEEKAEKVKLIMEMAEAISTGITPEEAADLCAALSKICVSLSSQMKRPMARWGLRIASSVLQDHAEEFQAAQD
jgi:hypothetical protein